MGYNERKKEQESQVKSLLAPTAKRPLNTAVTDVIKEGVKAGNVSPDDAIRSIAAMEQITARSGDQKTPPAGGYGRENLSSLYRQLFNAPAGTGKIQGVDEGAGVITKRKGKSYGPIGYGEGNVYVPGRDMSYEIRTPEDYRRNRDEFINQTQSAGSIPAKVQSFSPAKSLLSPGPSDESLMITEDASRRALKAAAVKAPTTVQPKPSDAAIMATEAAKRSELKPKPSFNVDPVGWAQATIPDTTSTPAALTLAETAPQPGESILDAQRRSLGTKSLLQSLFKTKNPWDWTYGFGDKPKSLSPVTSRKSMVRMK